MKKTIAVLMMAALPVLIGCKSESGETAETAGDTAATVAETPTPTPAEPEIMSKPSGVRYQELVVGTGVEAANQMKVDCHYTLWFADSTGLQKVQRFQSSKDNNGQPFTCTLGQRLIPGWSEGMIGMKEGGTRRIYIPWELGYGAQGGGPIPPKTNLIFEIDFLKAVQ